MHSIKRSISHQQSQFDEKLPAILEICQKMNAERSLAALLNLIAREATRLMEADRASIFLLDREKLELWSIVTLNGEQIRFDARLGITGAAAMTSQTINVEDAYEDPRFYKKIDARTGYRTRSMLIVPLRKHEGEAIGTFQVLNKKDGAFTQDDEEILQALATHVANAIETAQLVEELKLHREQLLEENTQLWKEVERRFSTQNILGTSPQIQSVVRLIEEVSDSSVNVLITGESGTGKELVAKAIHYNSSRARSSFLALNCAAVPESLVESELFGIEKGVATGVERRAGKFEEANGGILFLDEIGDMSPPMQAKMLRALQEREVVRVGGAKAIPVDIRVLAATNRDLKADIAAGKFREDLYYRLNVVNIPIAPLRERREDIPLLADYFLAQAREKLGKSARRFSSEAMDLLKGYNWPGNVRELENEVVRAVALSGAAQVIGKEVLSEKLLEGTTAKFRKYKQLGTMPAAVQGIEMEMISEYLEKTGGNKERAAKLLGISREGLRKKMKKYGMVSA